MEGCLGDAGAMKLEELFLGTLPTKDKAVSLPEAAQQITVLNESALAHFVEKGTQGNLKAAEKLILDLAAGHAPRIAANAGSFLVKLWNRLRWFCTLSLKHKSGKEVTLMGVEAIQHKWQEIKRMDTQTTKLQHLELLVTFLFLLPEEDQKKVHALTTQVYKQAGEQMGGSPSASQQSSQAEPASSSKASKTKMVVSSVSEAAQMFK